MQPLDGHPTASDAIISVDQKQEASVGVAPFFYLQQLLKLNRKKIHSGTQDTSATNAFSLYCLSTVPKQFNC
jgi:hypothetical protein